MSAFKEPADSASSENLPLMEGVRCVCLCSTGRETRVPKIPQALILFTSVKISLMTKKTYKRLQLFVLLHWVYFVTHRLGKV